MSHFNICMKLCHNEVCNFNCFVKKFYLVSTEQLLSIFSLPFVDLLLTLEVLYGVTVQHREPIENGCRVYYKFQNVGYLAVACSKD